MLFPLASQKHCVENRNNLFHRHNSRSPGILGHHTGAVQPQTSHPLLLSLPFVTVITETYTLSSNGVFHQYYHTEWFGYPNSGPIQSWYMHVNIHREPFYSLIEQAHTLK